MADRARSDPRVLAEGVLAGDRALLSRAITLVESARPEHRDRAQAVLEAVLPRAGGAHRIRANAILPGLIYTPETARFIDDPDGPLPGIIA